MTNGRLPSPQAQAFVVCREVWHNPRTNEFMIAGPQTAMLCGRGSLPIRSFIPIR